MSKVLKRGQSLKEAFKHNPNIPGGSSSGKPQRPWPFVARVAAVAVLVRWAGSEDFNRYKMPAEEFVRQIESAMPGLYEWRLSDLLVYEAKSGHFYTDLSKEYQLGDLLKNRGYKQGYSGTSDRGPNHDPRTRDNRSDEYWRRNERAPELEDFYAAVVRGCGVTDWKRYL